MTSLTPTTPGVASGAGAAVEGAAVTGAMAGGDKAGKPRSLFSDAIRDLRRNPVFYISGVLILLMLSIAIAPGLFTNQDPRHCELKNSVLKPSGEHWFGTNIQGCDVYARVIYGARPSIMVGFLSILVIGVIALIVGMAAGYFGGWTDSILARLTDIVFGIPFLVGAIVVLRGLYTYQANTEKIVDGIETQVWKELVRDVLGVLPVVLALALLAWPTAMRIMRSSVISAKQQDYVHAARALGAGHVRIMFRHILPNSIAPMIVLLTILMGGLIVAEATLSFLGVGLRDPIISWGKDILDAIGRVRDAPFLLLWPSLFLSATVLSFIMMGDAVRDAFDPKLR